MERNLKLYLAANALSLTGAWMHFVAIYWLAYELSKSAMILGMLSLTSGIPMLLFSLIGGTLSDRFSRKRMLLILQMLSAGLALILSLITYNKLSIEILFIFSALFGILFSLESPLKQTILPSLLEEKDKLSKAISWNTIINHLARMAGPFLCGSLLFLNKIYLAFAMYSGSIFISALIISYLNINNIAESKKKDTALEMFKEGLKYLSNSKLTLYSILTTSTLGFCIGPYTSQIPMLINEFYTNNTNQLSIFYAATGLGGLTSALALRNIHAKDNISPSYFIGYILSILALPAFFYGNTLIYGSIMLLLTSFGMMLTAGTGMIYIQNRVAEEYRGRVMGFYHLMFIGLAPISNGIFGLIAESFGSENAFILGALISLAAITAFFAKNIIPEKLAA